MSWNSITANADTLYELLKAQLAQCQLSQEKTIGLATFRATVMVWERGGVAAKLRKDNPLLINVHCVCHRLALACIDSNAG